MLIYRLPIARPDETLYSLAGRIRLNNTARCDRDACRSLFGQFLTTHVDKFPVDLEHFCSVTSGRYGSPHDVLVAHSLTPYFVSLDHAIGKECGQHTNPLAERFSLAHLSNGRSQRWRLCPNCVEREKKQFGVPYWHRQHQLPGSLMCALDGTVLYECELPALRRYNQFLLPNEVMSDRSLNLKLSDECAEILIELARFNSAIIFDGLTNRDLRAARSTILEALADRGLLAKEGRIDHKYLISDLMQRYRPLVSLRRFANDLSIGTLNRLAFQFSQNIVTSPKHELLLLFHLFGRWERYQTKYQWNLVFPIEEEGDQLLR